MTTTSSTVARSGSSTAPGARIVPVGDEPAMQAWAEALVDQARTQGVELTGDNGLLTALVQRALQTGLNVELPNTSVMSVTRSRAAGRVIPVTAAIPRR